MHPKGPLLSTSSNSILVWAAIASLTLTSYNPFPTNCWGGLLHTRDSSVSLLPVAQRDEAPTWSPSGWSIVLHHLRSVPWASHGLKFSVQRSAPQRSPFADTGFPILLSWCLHIIYHWLEWFCMCMVSLFTAGPSSLCPHPCHQNVNPTRGGPLLVLLPLYLGHCSCLLYICWAH